MQTPKYHSRQISLTIVSLLFLFATVGIGLYYFTASPAPVNLRASQRTSQTTSDTPRTGEKFVAEQGKLESSDPGFAQKNIGLSGIDFERRKIIDSSGYGWIHQLVKPWPKETRLEEIASRFKSAIKDAIQSIDDNLAIGNLSPDQVAYAKFARAGFRNFQGDPSKAYNDLTEARELVEQMPSVAKTLLYTLIYYQGLSSMRLGENENCIMCRGESSCILPISKSAIHKYPKGSRNAIKHFTEFLKQFPDDREVKWLLNVAYMTLGEHPSKVPAEYLVDLSHFYENEFDIGRFRDIGQELGLNRFNQAGGAIMDDFDNDGRLDIVVSSFDPSASIGLYFNQGDGRFEEWTEKAGVTKQLGGLNCMQTDYDNDGFKDIFIVRGAWLRSEMAMRPTLLRNNGDRTFTDVTNAAGLAEPGNAIAASWADYDNDGWLDLFVPCERQPNRLYRNQRNGTFEEVATKAGVDGDANFLSKGAAWIDIENDGFQDLFVNHLSEHGATIYRNNKDGTFTNATDALGIKNPLWGFSCWAWDFNNDGYLDIYASCYDRSVGSCVQGLQGEPHSKNNNALYLNQEGKSFKDVVHEVNLDQVHITMGSNFGDFDNDGFLDMYLGTGEPSLGTLVPNRMFKNIGGKRFADITVSSGTGNLQKGHGVACGDWDCDGNVDVFIQMGGAVNGDKYHNIMFQNPGSKNNWVNLKLVGEKTNKIAIGARIKVTTGGDEKQTFYRHISSGSSFGGNPLEQCIGIGEATSIDTIEISWPTSNSTQVFHNVPINQFYEAVEFREELNAISKNRIERNQAPPSEEKATNR